MIKIQEAIFSRLTGDTTLQTLLGGAGRIRAAWQSVVAQQTCVAFHLMGDAPGQVDGDSVKTRDSIWQFNVYADTNGAEIVDRLRILLDGHRFIPNSQTGGFSMHFSVGISPDFDEELKIILNTVRYRVHAVPVAVAEV